MTAMPKLEDHRADTQYEEAKVNVISSHRSRSTGTTVDVIDNRDGSFDTGDLGWFTLCEDHGGVASHPTRKLAVSWAPVPDEWCPECQEERHP